MAANLAPRTGGAPNGVTNTANSWSLNELSKLKRRALRTRAWWKLSRVERALVDAAIEFARKVRGTIKSRELVSMLSRIAEKARVKVRSFAERALSAGREMAAKYVALALSWGNRDALKWLEDPAYAIFLGVASLSTRWVYNFAPQGVELG